VSADDSASLWVYVHRLVVVQVASQSSLQANKGIQSAAALWMLAQSTSQALSRVAKRQCAGPTLGKQPTR
jgi:hypothetical protein